MNILKTPPLQFLGYKHFLKSEWKKGKLPSVRYGLYGGELTMKNLSLEHIIPVSQKGETILGNLALATMGNNFERGSEPIEKFLTKKGLFIYLKQFLRVKTDLIDGKEYAKLMIRALAEKLK